MAEIFENLENILLAWAREKIQKSLVDAFIKQVGEAGRRKKTVSFLGITLKKYSSSLSRQSSEKIGRVSASRRMRALVYMASRDKVDEDALHKGIQNIRTGKTREIEIWL